MENGINENFKIICINFFIDTKDSQNEILKILRKVKDFFFITKIILAAIIQALLIHLISQNVF